MYSVLVVDDDATCLLAICGILRSFLYDVAGAEDAVEALSMLRTKSFDLVISDVHMPPGMDGFQLLQQINQEFKLPVILVSGDDKEEVVIKAFKNGAVCFKLKPFTRDDFKDIPQHIEFWKNNISAQQENGQQDPNVGVSTANI